MSPLPLFHDTTNQNLRPMGLCEDRKMPATFEKERQSNLFLDAEGKPTYPAESECCKVTMARY